MSLKVDLYRLYSWHYTPSDRCKLIYFTDRDSCHTFPWHLSSGRVETVSCCQCVQHLQPRVGSQAASFTTPARHVHGMKLVQRKARGRRVLGKWNIVVNRVRLFLVSSSAVTQLPVLLQGPSCRVQIVATRALLLLSRCHSVLAVRPLFWVSAYQMGTGAGLQAALQAQCLGRALSPTHLPAAEALMLAKPCDGCFLFQKFAKFPTAVSSLKFSQKGWPSRVT